jgi:hypothetical protein
MEKVYAVYCFVYDEDTKKVLMVYQSFFTGNGTGHTFGIFNKSA